MNSSPPTSFLKKQIVRPALELIQSRKMANFHSRSNSFPSQSNPVMDDVQDHLCRLKSSTEASTSASSVCQNLASLRDLHESMNNLIQMPSIQQALSKEQGGNWINELLDGSLRLVDLCGFSRDVVCSTKEAVQELESSIRRSRCETASSDHIHAYAASRKKINKMVNKSIKNLKGFNQNSTALPDKDYDLKTIGTMLKEIESLDLSVLKSVLVLVSGKKERSNGKSWSFLSKFNQSSRVHSEMQQEIDTEGLEEGLESLFRSLVKIRVSLLNVLSY